MRLYSFALGEDSTSMNYRLHPPAVSARLTSKRSVHIGKVVLRAKRGDRHHKCCVFGLWHDPKTKLAATRHVRSVADSFFLLL